MTTPSAPDFIACKWQPCTSSKFYMEVFGFEARRRVRLAGRFSRPRRSAGVARASPSASRSGAARCGHGALDRVDALTRCTPDRHTGAARSSARLPTVPRSLLRCRDPMATRSPFIRRELTTVAPSNQIERALATHVGQGKAHSTAEDLKPFAGVVHL